MAEQKNGNWWCSCGQSKMQPFCDGSHIGKEKKRAAWCTCKHSKNKPYCDGTHMQDYIQQT